MFTTVIANDVDLSKIEKFQHLRACLVGAALATVSSLDPTEANYDKDVILLKNRFDNKLINFQAHIKEIFGLKGVDKGSASSLRQLSDKLNAHMRALETICSREQIADGLLIHIVNSKLDSQSQTKWEEGLQTDQLPTWSSMASFLERRCRMLENLESSMVTKKPNQQVSKKFNNYGRNVLVASSTTTPICYFFDAKDHYITNCSRFANLSPVLRFKEAKKLNLCLNCLRKGHRLLKCKFGTCRYCSMKHNSLLHMESNSIEQNEATRLLQTEAQEKANEDPKSLQTQSTLVSSSKSNVTPEALETPNGNNVFLATAIILVKNKFGIFVPCRAIFDSASQLNFITTRFAKQLQLKVKQSCVSISGIGDGNFIADKSANVVIKSCHSNYLLSFAAVIIPTITKYQPNTKFDVNKFQIPSNINLADPNFYKCGRIDILIGASLFFDLMSVGQFRIGDNMPILQKTQLGWIVAGGGTPSSNTFSLATAHTNDHETKTELLVDVVKSFWEIENNFENNSKLSTDDEFCEHHFQQNIFRLHSGQYSISLPKKLSIHELGDSYELARRRFLSLENKLKNPDDLEVLTPAHFLVGSTLTTILEPDLTELNINRLNRWQKVCYMQQVFWKKWSTAYLAILQERSKWRSTSINLTKGTMVLVKDENAPPLRWQLGRIEDVVPGKDGVVRVAIVKTSSNTFRRAVTKLGILPIEDNLVESRSLPTGGGCSL
ncbi:uncharacterized protein LOC119614626 [Lucilia sericata]|uniref:uncharacterized protein LOC119614626 n=1 Tax=Lucilia sericata TaxID=13632 RepID=UPI0018A84570|nr:uncharacterized protein LOC119614626 [Lucilia sericata]